MDGNGGGGGTKRRDPLTADTVHDVVPPNYVQDNIGGCPRGRNAPPCGKKLGVSIDKESEISVYYKKYS